MFSYYRDNQKIQWNTEFDYVLRNAWNKYFNEDEAYKDWIKYLGISDWRKISCVEDCFSKEKSISYDEYKNKIPRSALVVANEEDTVEKKSYSLEEQFFIEIPINGIGTKILEEVDKTLRKKQIPDSIAEMGSLFYKIRQQKFKEIRDKEVKKFKDTDVKVRNDIRTLKPVHVYAWVHKKVIASLL